MSSNLIQMIWDSFLETIIMVTISGGIGALAGIPLWIILFVTDRSSFLPMPSLNTILGTIINAMRSVPFIILLVAIIPFTRLIVGSSIGTAAAIVPLTLSVAPFIARIVETSLREVDKGLVEAAQSMGATNYQIISKVLLVRFYLTPVRMSKINKSGNDRCWQGCRERGTLLHCWLECKLVHW